MRKLLNRIVATWFAAFAIAGATVWAGAEDDAAETDAAVADGRAAVSAPHREVAD